MSSSGNERRGQTREVVDHMLAERQEMLVLLCRVSGVEPYHTPPDRSDFEEFRQVLTDYIAAAHFGLYARVADGKERRRGVVEVALRNYPRIAEITSDVVDFTERYDIPEGKPLPDDLPAALSRIGERLAERIELEDEIISALAHPRPALEVVPGGAA
jgi:regulator of sigma D